MNLGQSMFAIAALSILSYMALTANRNVASANDRMNTGEFGITAISLATSLVEEAMGKMFDAKIEDATTGELTSTSQLTPASSLGHGAGEQYRNGTSDFNDFDDFNNLFIVYKSNVAADTAKTTGSDWETIVPNIHAKYYVKSRVQYVSHTNLNATSSVPTWHKKITVTVINPVSKDTLVFPAVMSFWN